ncbi:hypothetical protein XF35_24745 [Streptomyces platensis subsp. clarensis]|nr:hypothetical protein [Streptomyces platensis subsp. clarensis]
MESEVSMTSFRVGRGDAEVASVSTQVMKVGCRGYGEAVGEMRELLSDDMELACRRAALLTADRGGEPATQTVSVDDSGWDFRVFRIGAWCLRVARRSEAAMQMDREAEALVAVRRVVGVPVPEPVELRPGVTIGPWLEGRPLRAEDVPGVADELARVLSDLHGLEPFALAPAGRGMAREPSALTAGARRRAMAALEEARRYGLRSPDVEVLGEGIENTALWRFRPAIVHADLTPNHILVTGDGSAIAGLLDWSDIRQDDPAIDLAGVGSDLGEAAGDALVSAYLRYAPHDELLRRRVRIREAWARLIEAVHHIRSSSGA